jgi:hypothetical protein
VPQVLRWVHGWHQALQVSLLKAGRHLSVWSIPLQGKGLASKW